MPHDSATSPTSPSDLEVVEEVRRGNREMFEVLVRRYNPQLYRVGMAYLRDHAQAEDAMQNAYLKCFVHLGKFQRGAAFSTWLTRIMINECLMALRRRKTAALDRVDFVAEDSSAWAPATSSDPIQLNEMKALFEHAIAALPQTYRAVYMLREIQQLSTVETAECLGISEESVKVTLHRARARLKNELLNSAAGLELFTYPAEFCTPMTERVIGLILRVARREA